MIGRHSDPAAPGDDPHAVAARWFARQRSGEMTDEARLELRLWLEDDPANTAAYVAVRRAWGGSGSVKSDPRVLAMREHWSAVDAAPAVRLPGRALAACIAAAMLVVGGLAGWQVWTAPNPLADRVYRTAVGERRTVELPDGSVVTLNTHTVLRTQRDGSRRLLFLEEGQAFFQVAKHPDRPFVVTAAGRTVTALGTTFDVRVEKGEFKVTLVEGKVRVETLVPRAPRGSAPLLAAPKDEPAVQATEMVAGSQLIAPANEDWRITRTNVAVETSWTKGRLIFDHEKLGAVVEELNRYSDRKIVLGDPELAEMRIGGTFKPGDVSSFVAALEEYQVARGGRVSEYTVELLPY